MSQSQINWDHTVDILVVGSGAGALTAALRAAHTGAKVLVIEKSRYYGGTSATSGGGLWIPCNHLMPAVNIEDNREDALQYLLALTGSDVPRENVEAFVTNGRRMLEWLCGNSDVEYMAMEHYSDYYQQLPGARPGGRSIDPLPYDARELGDDFLNMQESHRQTRVLGLMGYSNIEGAILLSKSPGWFKLVMKLAFEYFADIPWRFKSMRSRRLTMGNALIGRLRKSLKKFDVPIWLQCPAQQLIVENGAVVGVKALRNGTPIQIRAQRGVILGSGGFEHSQALRERYLPSPTSATWSAASPYNTGDMLVAGQAIGAATSLLDEAWWGPSIVVEGEDRARALFTERSMPGAILVNQFGKRFVNESVAYTTAVQAMYEPGNLPTYLIFDSRYKRDYPFGPLLPGGMHLNWLQPGHIRTQLLKSADSLDDLAELLNIPARGLADTVQQFNQFAQTGKDEHYRRGENSYDLIYGDVRIKPNPCLAPLVEAPFYAIEVYPGDIGTKGGLLTNPNAQVVDQSGNAIPGLYAIGNCSASVMGRYYPGAGATLGPAMTFGFLAAEHACGSAS
ncbi:MAG TPA: FAD-dependent oxidoreductase [Spongiibacteraceae bacterium]|jgi:3-oxosteroid 1-dehydrogenase